MNESCALFAPTGRGQRHPEELLGAPIEREAPIGLEEDHADGEGVEHGVQPRPFGFDTSDQALALGLQCLRGGEVMNGFAHADVGRDVHHGVLPRAALRHHMAGRVWGNSAADLLRHGLVGDGVCASVPPFNGPR